MAEPFCELGGPLLEQLRSCLSGTNSNTFTHLKPLRPMFGRKKGPKEQLRQSKDDVRDQLRELDRDLAVSEGSGGHQPS